MTALDDAPVFDDTRVTAPPGRTPEVTLAEKALLGSMISHQAAAEAALDMLGADDAFGEPLHQSVCGAVRWLTEEGPAPGDLKGDALVRRRLAVVLGRLVETGHGIWRTGSAGVILAGLMQHATPMWREDAAVVLRAASQRRVVAALGTAIRTAARPGYDAAEGGDMIRKLIDDASGRAVTAALRPNSEAVTEVLAAIEAGKAPGVPTGFPDLDEATGGLRPGEMTVIAARPGVGKTAIALNIADHVGTRLGLPVLFSSLEMTEPELTVRRISAASKVPLYRLVHGTLTRPEWDMIARVHARLTDTRLFVDDTPGASLAHIRGRLRAMERAGEPARLLVIDYLGFMSAPRAESRQQAVAELARGVKTSLARELGIPVILLAQLNRGPEHRSGKVPEMADLRESGEIEQSADVVILLHREDAYERESPRAGETDLLVRKNRQGPTCTITLAAQMHYARFQSMARDWSPPGVFGDAA